MVVTSVGGYRQVPAERFAKLFTEAGASSVEVVEDVEKAFGRALEGKGDGRNALLRGFPVSCR